MTKPVQSLIVDDDDGIRFFLETVLKGAGHHVTLAVNAERALDLLRDHYFDLAILDLELGGRMNGLRLLEAIKWRWPHTATLILTAHGSLESAMAAIREGVDIYLLKPAKAEEVRQAVQEALSRRKNEDGKQPDAGADSEAANWGPFQVNLEKRTVFRGGESLDLTNCEFDLLVYMMENGHRILSPQELVQVVREYQCADLNEARDIIKWYVHSLRRKVELNPSKPRYILNVRGVGYTFKA